jgi:hypothetical protein
VPLHNAFILSVLEGAEHAPLPPNYEDYLPVPPPKPNSAVLSVSIKRQREMTPPDLFDDPTPSPALSDPTSGTPVDTPLSDADPAAGGVNTPEERPPKLTSERAPLRHCATTPDRHF